MSTLFFFARCIVMTFLIVILAQIRIGPTTLEEKASLALQQSSLIEILQPTVDGSVRLIRDVWRSFTGGISTPFWKSLQGSAPGSRSLGIDLQRSKAYLEKQKDAAKSKIQEQFEEKSPE